MLGKLRRGHYDKTMADMEAAWKLSPEDLAQVLDGERAMDNLRTQLRLAQLGQQVTWKTLQNKYGLPDRIDLDRETGMVWEVDEPHG